MRANWKVVSGIAGALVLGFGGWMVLAGSRASIRPSPQTPVPLELSREDIAVVRRMALTRSLPISGTLEPLVQTTIRAQVPGVIEVVGVREGQTVHRGDVLLKIDRRNLLAQLEDRQAAVDKASADLALAIRNRDNSRVLLRQRFIAQSAYDTKQNAYRVDRANLKAARAQLRLAQIALDFATVRAPIDGIVSSRYVNPGEMVGVDTNLIGLVDLSTMELQVPAPASEIPGIHPGQVARFHVDGFGKRAFTGRVQRVNPVSQAGSRSILIYLAVANPHHALRGGMFVQGDLVLDAGAPAPSIPESAVRDDAGTPYVYVLERRRAVRRPVQLGLRSRARGLVQVRSGLRAGERVVATSIDGLKDGSAVTLGGNGVEPASTLARRR